MFFYCKTIPIDCQNSLGVRSLFRQILNFRDSKNYFAFRPIGTKICMHFSSDVSRDRYSGYLKLMLSFGILQILIFFGDLFYIERIKTLFVTFSYLITLFKLRSNINLRIRDSIFWICVNVDSALSHPFFVLLTIRKF